MRKLLARMRYCSPPEFMIIGAQKSGTSALYDMLCQHPDLHGSRVKEIHYFDDDEWYSRGRIHEYHAFFPLPHEKVTRAKTFEATPIYLFHPEVAGRLHRYNAGLKLIVLLREPAMRAFSAWTMYHHLFKTGKNVGLHDRRTFSRAVEEELATLDARTFDDDKRGYVRRGLYREQLERFLTHFSPQNLLILESREIMDPSEEASVRISDFLGIGSWRLPAVTRNPSKVDERKKYAEDILRLKDFYAPHNEALYALIGKRYDWNESK